MMWLEVKDSNQSLFVFARPEYFGLACVAGVWKGREREFSKVLNARDILHSAGWC